MDKARERMGFELSFFAMVASQGAGLVGATQLLVDPTSTWVSWTVVIALLGLAIVSTIKVVRFVDSVQREMEELRKMLTEREKTS